MAYIVLNCISQIASVIQNGVLVCCYLNDNMKLKFPNFTRIVSENMLLAAVICWNLMCTAHFVLVTVVG